MGRQKRNYLRVRGEYSSAVKNAAASLELPPRARRIHLLDFVVQIFDGTTSACAENTALTGCFSTNSRNYLRVRGEYTEVLNQLAEKEELPPRARRILTRYTH